jgi:hypothetical protein
MNPTIPIWGCNLGDTLWVTPVLRHLPGCTVEMLASDARSRATAPILDGLGHTMKWVDSTVETPKDNSVQEHVTQRILRAYGLGGRPSIPRIILTGAEIEWAIEYLRSKGVPDLRRAVVFVNHNSGTNDPANPRARYVRPHPEVVKALARFWAQGGRNTIVQFGPDPGFYDGRDPFDPIPGAVHIRGLSVRQLAACYHVVGKVVTGDTGDKHLGLAVGATVACMVPRHSDAWGYKHWDLLYDGKCWGEERPRLRYTLHENWTRFMTTDLFTEATVDMADTKGLS